MKKTQWRNWMPGFYDALNNRNTNLQKKHFVTIQGQNIEVSLEQKLQIQKAGEDAYFCQKGPNGIIVCKKPIVPKEQKQTQLVKSDQGTALHENNPFWPTEQGYRKYKWKIK